MKISKEALWLLSVRHKFNFSPKFDCKMIEHDITGVDWMTAFIAYDTYGKILLTKHPRTLRKIIKAKGGLNFQIKQWAEALAFGYTIKIELTEYLYKINAPSWVLDAVQKQRYNIVFSDSNVQKKYKEEGSTYRYGIDHREEVNKLLFV
jgi:hypothetical protein